MNILALNQNVLEVLYAQKSKDEIWIHLEPSFMHHNSVEAFMSSTESACLVMGYYYFPDGSGEYAASSPLKHEALVWNSISGKNDVKSCKQNKIKRKRQKYELGSLTVDFLQLCTFYSASVLLSSFCLFGSVTIFILTFYFIK